MLRAVSILLAINAVFCLNCLQLDPFKNDKNLINHLNGKFFVLYTSDSDVVDCENGEWTVTDNERFGIVQSPGCCRKLSHIDLTNPLEVRITLDPIRSDSSGCLTTSEIGSFKLIGTTGSGDNFCFISFVCREGRQGVYVMCRNPTPMDGLLQEITGILLNLIRQTLFRLLFGIQLKSVSQDPETCIFSGDNCSP